jgi:hypothetical protein
MKASFSLSILFSLVLFLFSCNKSDHMDLIQLLYPNRDFKGIYPKQIYYKEAFLDPSRMSSGIYIFRDKNEELLAMINSNTVIFQKRYVLLNYGGYEYNLQNKEFVPTNLLDLNQGMIINDISYHKIGNDEFYSLFFTILSEEPPIGLFKVPMIYRNGTKIFDGLNTLKEEDFLRNWKTVSYKFENGNQFLVTSPGGEYLKFFWENNAFTLLAETK